MSEKINPNFTGGTDNVKKPKKEKEPKKLEINDQPKDVEPRQAGCRNSCSGTWD